MNNIGIVLLVSGCGVVETIADRILGVSWPMGWRGISARVIWLACGFAISKAVQS
jgi:hypothetical protein